MTESDSKRTQIQYLIVYGEKLKKYALDPRESIESWLPLVKSILPRNYLGRITRLSLFSSRSITKSGRVYRIIGSDVDAVLALLRDELLKFDYESGNERDLFALRIIRARENSDSLEKSIAERMCGENPNFPEEICLDFENFFLNLGHNPYINYNAPTFYVTDFLMRLDSLQLLDLIQNGLFNKKYYQSVDENNGKRFVNLDAFKRATEDFNFLLEELSVPTEPISLSHIFNVSQTYDLIFNSEYDTSDDQLNSLLEEARRFYLAGEYQIAIEKLWDAFERIKTVLDSDKCNGANKLIESMVVDIDRRLIDDEFQLLKKVGNDYKIRHHETGKINLTSDVEKRYLYFRMLALIDYALHSLEKVKFKAP